MSFFAVIQTYQRLGQHFTDGYPARHVLRIVAVSIFILQPVCHCIVPSPSDRTVGIHDGVPPTYAEIS